MAVRLDRLFLLSALAVMAMVFPWLNTLATGPSTMVVSVLVAWAAAALLMLFWPKIQPGTVGAAWLLAALFSSLIGLSQFFGVEQYFQPWMSSSPNGEVFGNLRQRNQFASLINIGLLALLWWMQGDRIQSSRYSGTYQVASTVAAVLLMAGNAASASRTGLLQLGLIAVLAVYWGMWRRPHQRNVLIAALLGYGVAAFALPMLAGNSVGILSRFREIEPSCVGRTTLWRNVMALIAQRPWQGWGWGELDYAHFMTLVSGSRFCGLVDNAHNLPLHLAAELGVPVALLICGTVAWLTWRAKPWREIHPIRQMAWGVLVVIALHSMLEYPLWYGPFQMALGLSLGLLWWVRPDSILTPSASRIRWQQCLAAALLAVIAYAAWDYHRISQIYLAPAQRSDLHQTDTLEKIRGSWLFRDQVLFAEFTLTPLTRDNAAQLNAMAHEMLHFSPEAPVVEKLIESALILGRDDEAHFFMTRYRVAYPKAYEHWLGEGTSAVK